MGLSQLIGLVGAGITLAFGAKVPKMALIVPAAATMGVGGLLVGTAVSPAPFTREDVRAAHRPTDCVASFDQHKFKWGK